MLGGVLKDFTAQALGELVTRALLERNKIKPEIVGELIFGCVGQSSDAPNITRVIALRSGMPASQPSYTVGQNCASGLQAIVSAAREILLNETEIVIAGGTESMSASPFVNRDLRFGKKLRNSTMIDTLWEGLTDPVCGQIMGRTAENLAKEFSISRSEQDKFALESHKKAFRATREGRFKDEIIPVKVVKKVMGKELPPETIIQDEGINVGLTEQILSQYPIVFMEPGRESEGTVTPGNSCPISDGASAVLLMKEERAKSLGLTPLGFIKSYGFAGVEPHRMGIGPACASPIALKKAGLSLKDMDLIEVNEAFAAQYLAVEKCLGLERAKVNVNGGAIALGHPVGTSGCRIVVTLLNELKKRNLNLGLATLCVGGGMGGAVVVERN
jgi:acetyl-CoA C-acetyltransferase